MSQNENSNYIPIFLNIENQHVLIVGGGEVAQRKLKVLLGYNLFITIISPDITNSIRVLADNNNRITIINEEFDNNHFNLKDFKLIFAATNDEKLNHNISKYAKIKGMLANIATSLDECHFIMPAIIQEGPLQIAISTSGNSPLLAKKVKKDLSENYIPKLNQYSKLLGDIRLYIKEIIKNDTKKRQEIYNIILNSTDLLSEINSESISIEQAITTIIQKLDGK